MLSDAQLAERRTGIGGSDIAAIMGVSPWATATDIFNLKLDLVEVPESEAMYWGSALEGVVLDRYLRDRTEWASDTLGTLRGEDGNPWCLATPDAIICTTGDTDWLYGVEIKTANAFAAKEWDEGVPEHYVMQCQWYMFVCDLPRWDVAVLIGGNDYREFTLERDAAMIAEMFAAGDHFWHEHVEKEIPPEPTTPAECAQQFTSDDGEMIGANAEMEDLAIDLHGAMKKAALWKEDVSECKARIQQRLGNHAGIQGPWGKITWKANAKGTRRFVPKWNEDWIEEHTR